MNPAMRWLCLDGLVPLLGAGFLFVVWGGALYVTSSDKSAFKFAWHHAIDPMGWLYGASILAVQSGFASAASGDAILEALCFTAGGICLILLLAAMSNRGSSTDQKVWEAPKSLQLMAGGLIIAILFAGYRVHTTGVKSSSVEQHAQAGVKSVVQPLPKQPKHAPSQKNGGPIP